jgi:hypothetical protein
MGSGLIRLSIQARLSESNADPYTADTATNDRQLRHDDQNAHASMLPGAARLDVLGISDDE